MEIFDFGFESAHLDFPAEQRKSKELF